MKKIILSLTLLFTIGYVTAQSAIDSLVQMGIQFHDSGEYDKAMEWYKKALAIDSNSSLVNYEMAMTSMYMQDYYQSIKYSDKVIAQKDNNMLNAYITKGSSLDYLGKTGESIKVFEEAIAKFGDNHLLYYNLALNYYNTLEYAKSEDAAKNAIRVKPGHPGSHLLLGTLMNDLNKPSQSLLSLYYFLFLEPNTERSASAYQLLQNLLLGHVERDKEKTDHINIYYDAIQADAEFSAADLMISMLEAADKIDDQKHKNAEEKFEHKTKSFFTIVGELQKKKNKGLWWDYYVPFFSALAKSDHLPTFCYYISSGSSEKAKHWMDKNESKLTQFDDWLKEY